MNKLIPLVIATALCVPAASPASAETLAELKARMDNFADSFRGTLGYSLHFKGKPEATISRLPDEPFPTASTIKTAIMCEVMHQIDQGKVKWTDQLEVQPSDDRQGGGFAFHFKEGTKLSIGQWVHLMITVSDNTATMLLREHVGQKNVNDWLAAHGFKVTRLLNGKKCDELGLRPLQREYGLGMATPSEMMRLHEMIHDGKAASPASTDRMVRILAHQYWDDDIASQAPPMKSASKSGWIGRNYSDVAFVSSPMGDYVLAIYIKECADGESGNGAIRALAEMVWRHFDPARTWSPPPGAAGLLP